MRPIRLGDRGPAVEDIQRRLLMLGYELGPTGVDGVFLGLTADAVRSFQAKAGVSEDALVGSETWAALVDATFTFGDRMLYLRLPHFHGRDVRVLQEALSVLGFACGQIDGILGAFTESAIREFQRNAGLNADGIVGDETFGVLGSLRHVWAGKDPRSHSAAVVGAARAAEVLRRPPFSFRPLDAQGAAVCERILNLARATTPEAAVAVLEAGTAAGDGVVLVVGVCGDGTESAVPGRPVVVFDPADSLSARLRTAHEASKTVPSEIVLQVPAERLGTEHDAQRTAVVLLDGVCSLFD